MISLADVKAKFYNLLAEKKMAKQGKNVVALIKSLQAIFRKWLNFKSGLRILIWPLEVQFFWSENGHFWAKVTQKNGTSSGQIKILRPLL